MVWTDEQVEQLKKLWEKGLTTGEIGKALGVSKNAVVGKAHRLELNGRPSPIRRNEEEEVEQPAETEEKTTVVEKKKTAKTTSAPKRVEKDKKKLFTVNDLTAHSCRWPIGDPKDEDFHFCGKEALPDKPYCAEHAAIAYVSAKTLR